MLNDERQIIAGVADKDSLPPEMTALGALLKHITGGAEKETFQPMNINFGLFPDIDARNERGKRAKGKDRKKALSDRARQDLDFWLERQNIKKAA